MENLGKSSDLMMITSLAPSLAARGIWSVWEVELEWEFAVNL